jgi:hypothetical protein
MLTKPLDRAHARVRISEDLGAEMSDPRMNLPERPDEPMTLGLGRGIDEDASDPASGRGKLQHLNVRLAYQESHRLRAHEFFPF